MNGKYPFGHLAAVAGPGPGPGPGPGRLAATWIAGRRRLGTLTLLLSL